MKVTRRFQVEELELNMTPMIDVTFQLLIFFMVCTELATYDRVEDLHLPVADQAKPETIRPDRLIISVDRKNQIWIRGRVCTLARVERELEVEKRARGFGTGRTKQPILIQADRNARWQVIQDIIEKANEQKFWQLSFGARNEGG